MYIEFKYKIEDYEMLDFIYATVLNCPSNEFIGYLNQVDQNILKICSLYLVAKSEYTIDEPERRTKPLLIVAKNEISATQYYYDITGDNNGTVVCEIKDNCSNLKVEPTGIYKDSDL